MFICFYLINIFIVLNICVKRKKNSKVSKVDHKIMIKNKLRINRFFLFLLKIFNKKSILFIFLTLHLVIGLKSIDFCLSKQKECKGESYFFRIMYENNI